VSGGAAAFLGRGRKKDARENSPPLGRIDLWGEERNYLSTGELPGPAYRPGGERGILVGRKKADKSRAGDRYTRRGEGKARSSFPAYGRK